MAILAPIDWCAYTDDATAYKRAGGRRHYNSVRHERAMARRAQLWAQRYQLASLSEVWGWQKRMAKLFGVSRATICHDWRLIRLGKAW